MMCLRCAEAPWSAANGLRVREGVDETAEHLTQITGRYFEVGQVLELQGIQAVLWLAHQANLNRNVEWLTGDRTCPAAVTMRDGTPLCAWHVVTR